MSTTWTKTSAPSGGTTIWFCVTSSSDGTKLAAVANFSKIYTSTNSGNTWSNSNNSTSAQWRSIATSSDGTKLVACFIGNSGNTGIYTSTDSGITWTNQTSGLPTGVGWISITSSSDGTKLAACINNGGIYTSTNSGVTWTNSNNAPILAWRSITSSSDGTKLAACSSNNVIYTSTDSGNNWTPSNSLSKLWNSITSSSDGTKLAAVVNFEKVYTSTDSGVNWSNSNSSPAARWYSITSSSDGTNLAAVANAGGLIYTSTDNGSTWTQNTAPSSDWISISSNTDGTKLVAVTAGSGIYTNFVPPPPPYPCFKEGSLILTDKGYKPVQDLRKGDLVKTLLHGVLPIDMIGKRDIVHKANVEDRIKDQLYKCSQPEYPDIFEPLILTGCHSILVDDFTSEKQREKTIEVNGDTYVTDNKYRLPACADERAAVYEIPGTYTIYHLALENTDKYMNYGIYANGLLVESCSKWSLNEHLNMELIE